MDSVDRYIEFVQEQIEKYIKYSKLVYMKEVPPFAVYKALAEYSDVNLTLLSEQERAEREYNFLLEDYNEWWDKVFIESKNKLNPLNIPGSKFSSKVEIEASARNDNRKEFQSWRNRLRDVEDKVKFYKRLVENWKRHKDILTNLSLHMRSEVRSLGIEDEAYKEPEKKPIRK